MISFTKRIKTLNGTLPFYFNAIDDSNNPCIHISVTDKDRSLIFLMKERDGLWQITSDRAVPHWIAVIESNLHSEIVENLSYQDTISIVSQGSNEADRNEIQSNQR